MASIVGWSIGPAASGGLPAFATNAARSCRTMPTSTGKLTPPLPTDLVIPVIAANLLLLRKEFAARIVCAIPPAPLRTTVSAIVT
jgi:hypothetical protein